MKSDMLRCILLLLSGFLTFVLLEILPVAGFGGSLIIVITIPFLILLGAIFFIIYHGFYQEKTNQRIKDRAFYIMFFITILMNFVLFPYK